MSLLVRVTILSAVLGGGLAGGYAFQRHLEAAGPLPAVPLARPLAAVPLQLGDWDGVEEPITDQRLLYADEHLQRTYRHRASGTLIRLWMVYSREGADRGHHPEVCMAVAGQVEDPAGRVALPLPGHAAPVQQFRYGRPGSSQLVYYWYYTLKPPAAEKVSPLQRAYQRTRRRPSGVTVEVFAPEQSGDDARLARDFVARVDAALQAHLGPTAVRGSRRMPVTVVERTEDP